MKKIILASFLAGSTLAMPLRGQTTIADFESDNPAFSIPAMTSIGDMKMEIADNPLRKGINTSKKVLKMTRQSPDREIWAGFNIPVHPRWADATNPNNYKYVHVKYMRENEESLMRFKLFRKTFDEHTIERTSMVDPVKTGVWEDMVFDLSTGKGNYENLSIMPDFRSGRGAGITVYIDDITFSNDPLPQMMFAERLPQVQLSGNYSDAICLHITPVPHAREYEVYANGKRIHKTGNTDITINKLKPQTRYTFQVRAISPRSEKSRFSEKIEATTLAVGQLAMPMDYHYKEVTETTIRIAWSPVYKATAYEIYENGAYYTTVTDTEHTIKGLTPYSLYMYQVKAINPSECSPLTDELYFVTNETLDQRNARMQWWRESRFGMFIHWGVYTMLEGRGRNHRKTGAPVEWQPASNDHSQNSYGEWIMEKYDIPVKEYREYAKQVTLDKFNPTEWVKLAEEAGMKYLILGSKHHDGFCLWDTKTTDWNTVKSTPYADDMVRAVNDAAKANGMKFGLYFSHALDWFNGGSGRRWDKDMNVRTFDNYLTQVGIPQVEELLSNYGKLDILWWDMPIEMTPERSARYYHAVSKHFNAQKGMVLNDRMPNRIYFKDEKVPYELKGDHNTPEQSIPDVPPTGFADGRDWETCMTLNATWGYKANDNLWKSPEDIIRKLADIVSKGGNFLINIGPKPDGSFPEESITLLKEVGRWMAVNGESIYGTIKNPFEEGVPYGRCTRKVASNGQTTLYLHVFDWPQDGKLSLPTNQKVKKAWLLADKEETALQVTTANGSQQIHVPTQAPDAINSVVAVVLN